MPSAGKMSLSSCLSTELLESVSAASKSVQASRMKNMSAIKSMPEI